MNDLENHGLLELPVLCCVKPHPRLLNSFLGRCLSLLLLQLHGAAGCTCLYGEHIPHTFHCSSGLWPTDWPRGGGRNYNQGMEITWEASAMSHSKV